MNEYRIFLTGEVAGAWKRLVGRFYWLHDNNIIEHLLEIHSVYCKQVCLLELSNETQTSRPTGNKEKPDLIPSASISTESGLASRLHGNGSTECVTKPTDPNKGQSAVQSMVIKEEPECMEFTDSDNLRDERLLPLTPSTRDPGGGGISSAGELNPSSKSSLPVIVNVASLANVGGQEVTPLVQSLGLEVTPRIQQPVMQDSGVNLYSQGQKVLWIVKNGQNSVQPLNPHCIQSVNQNHAHLVSQNSVQTWNPNSIQLMTQSVKQNTAQVVNPNNAQLLNQSSAHLVNQNTAKSVQSVNPASIQLLNQNSTQSVKQYSAQAVNLNNAELLNQSNSHIVNPNSSHAAENLSEKVDQEHGRNQGRKESVSRNLAEEDEGPSTSLVDDSETEDEFSEVDSKETRRSYTFGFKLKVIAYAEINGGNRAAERKFGVCEAAVRQWRKQKDKLSQLDKKKKSLRRGTAAFWPELENKLEAFVLEQRAKGRRLSHVKVRQKAVDIAKSLHIKDFKGRPGWYNGFLRRKGLSVKR